MELSTSVSRLHGDVEYCANKISSLQKVIEKTSQGETQSKAINAIMVIWESIHLQTERLMSHVETSKPKELLKLCSRLVKKMEDAETLQFCTINLPPFQTHLEEFQRNYKEIKKSFEKLQTRLSENSNEISAAPSPIATQSSPASSSENIANHHEAHNEAQNDLDVSGTPKSNVASTPNGQDDMDDSVPTKSVASASSKSAAPTHSTLTSKAQTKPAAHEQPKNKIKRKHVKRKPAPVNNQRERDLDADANESKVYDAVRDLGRGSFDFMAAFRATEHLLNNEKAVDVQEFRNGTEFLKSDSSKKIRGVYLIKSKEGLGLIVPEGPTVEDFRKQLGIESTAVVNVTNSVTQAKLTRSIIFDDVVQAFSKDRTKNDKMRWNVLSLECCRQATIHKNFVVPSNVEKLSLVSQLEKVMRETVETLKAKMSNSEGEEKNNLAEEIGSIEYMLESMPQYRRYFILSMKDVFTDVHVDMAGTPVYYHVKKGKKVFYVARYSEENLELFKRFEMKQETGWIAEQMAGKWRRIEINEGETAMIESGLLHFVYTPEDSIVFGGNFLTAEDLETHFKVAKQEELLVRLKKIEQDTVYRGFRDVMWLFAEYILLPVFRSGSEPTAEQKRQASVLVQNMNETDGSELISRQKRKEILEFLEEKTGMTAKRERVNTLPKIGYKRKATSKPSKPAKKAAKPSEEASDVAENEAKEGSSAM